MIKTKVEVTSKKRNSKPPLTFALDVDGAWLPVLGDPKMPEREKEALRGLARAVIQRGNWPPGISNNPLDTAMVAVNMTVRAAAAMTLEEKKKA